MSVTAKRPCRTCLTTQTDCELKLSFNEKNFNLRDATTHQDHVKSASEPNLNAELLKFWKFDMG